MNSFVELNWIDYDLGGFRCSIVGVGLQKAKDFKAHSRNPKIHPESQNKAIAASLREFGWANFVIVNKASGNLLDGHERVESQIKSNPEGLIPFILVDIPVEREPEFLIVFDRSGNLAIWAPELVQDLLADIKTDEEAISDMLVDLASELRIDFGPELEEEPFVGGAKLEKADEYQSKWKVETGQMWKLGNHRLICGDCGNPEVVQKLMDGEQADMMMTDPPYNVSYQDNESVESLRARNRRTDGMVVNNDSMSEEEFGHFLVDFLNAAPLKAGGAFYICSPAGDTETQFRYSIRSADKYTLRQCIVWVKDQFVFGRQDYHWRHESILYRRADVMRLERMQKRNK